MKRLPNFIIIGGMKCATSTLHEQLGAQPGIFTSRQKELQFFSNDEMYAKGLAWYSSFFQRADAGDICGESSTHYSKLPRYPQTVSRIKRQLGTCRFIYIMRDPIDRLISQYIHQWTEREMSGSIDECVKQHDELISYSEYSRQLQPYFDTFGKTSVLPVFLNRIRLDPQRELERVCRFIGYHGTPTWQPKLAMENASAARMLHSPIRDWFVDLPGIKHIRKHLIPQAYRDAVKRYWQISDRPILSPELHSMVSARLDADLAKLGSWVGLDLKCANFREMTVKVPHSPDWCDREDPVLSSSLNGVADKHAVADKQRAVQP